MQSDWLKSICIPISKERKTVQGNVKVIVLYNAYVFFFLKLIRKYTYYKHEKNISRGKFWFGNGLGIRKTPNF